MARCEHGFELSSVRCPSGCRDGVPAAAPKREELPRVSLHRGREKTYTDDELRAALRCSSSIREVADRLGVGQKSVYLRCRSKKELWALYERAKAVSGNLGNKHPGFKDMTGERIGVLTVFTRAENQANGNAAWRCLCEACGAECIYQGIQLRARRAAPPSRCRECPRG